MENLKDLGSLTIKEILEISLGREETEKLLGNIQQAVARGIRGDDLRKLIYQELCNLSVTDIEVYQLLLYVAPKPVVTGP